MNNLGTRKLETERLILRRIEQEDYKQAYENWCSREMVEKYVLWSKHANPDVTKKLYEKWISEYDDNETYRWIIEFKENKEVIGTIDVSKKFLAYSTCELGYCLSDDYWNKGIMTEAIKRVIKFLFEECGAKTIWAEFLKNNPASGRVMQKVGMKYEGILRKRVVDKEENRNDLLVYSILDSEYYETESIKRNS